MKTNRLSSMRHSWHFLLPTTRKIFSLFKKTHSTFWPLKQHHWQRSKFESFAHISMFFLRKVRPTRPNAETLQVDKISFQIKLWVDSNLFGRSNVFFEIRPFCKFSSLKICNLLALHFSFNNWFCPLIIGFQWRWMAEERKTLVDFALHTNRSTLLLF